MPAFSAVDKGVCGEAGLTVDGVYDDEEDEGPGLGEGREWLAACDGGAEGGGIKLL